MKQKIANKFRRGTARTRTRGGLGQKKVIQLIPNMEHGRSHSYTNAIPQCLRLKKLHTPVSLKLLKLKRFHWFIYMSEFKIFGIHLLSFLVLTSNSLQMRQTALPISHWHSVLSAGSSTMFVFCMDGGCFTFTLALCLTASCVFWRGPECDVNLNRTCTKSSLSGGELFRLTDVRSLSLTVPFQIGPWLTQPTVPLPWLIGLMGCRCILIGSLVGVPICWT